MDENMIISTPQAFSAFLRSEAVTSRIEEVCSGSLTADTVKHIYASKIAASPALLRCTFKSVYAALLDATALGLTPVLGRCHLVPFGSQCTLMIGYQGLIDLAARHGIVVFAESVFDGEEFRWEQGLNPRLSHVPRLDVRSARDRDRLLLAAYCVTVYPANGIVPERRTFTVMSRQEIEDVRAVSKSGRSDVWKEHYVEMAKKTVIRRAAKYWPLPEDAAMAIERDDREFGVRTGQASREEEAKARLAAVFESAPALPDPEPGLPDPEPGLAEPKSQVSAIEEETGVPDEPEVPWEDERDDIPF